MKRTRSQLLLISLPSVVLLSIVQVTIGQDFDIVKQSQWHQWRGPNANGVSETAQPPLNWSDQTSIKWKVPIVGEGSSTPIVWDKYVFLLSAVETNLRPREPVVRDPAARTEPPQNIYDFVVWCIDRSTGDVRWKKTVNDAAPHEGRHSSTTYAAGSPTTDGQHLYASFGSYGVYCLTFEGDLVWKRDLGKMRTRRGWGEGVSPVLHDHYLVVNWDQEDQSHIYVLNKNTGETIWEAKRDEPTTWATPLIVPFRGQTQLITNGTNRVRSYDLRNGSIIWESPGTTLNAIPCPVRDRDHVICMAGYQGNLALSIPLDSQGEVSKDEVGAKHAVKWKVERDTPYVPSPLAIDGRLYFTKSNNAILNCLNLDTGKPVYEKTRLPELKSLYASPVAADGKIYLVSREGITLVIENGPAFKILATNRLSDEIDASPALVGKQVFLRGKRFLFCIEE
jgi:outer membrane protein assembly factor BamB